MIRFIKDRTIWQNIAYMLSGATRADEGARNFSDEYFQRMYDYEKSMYIVDKTIRCDSGYVLVSEFPYREYAYKSSLKDEKAYEEKDAEEEFAEQYDYNLKCVKQMPPHFTFLVADLRVLALGIVCPEVKKYFDYIYENLI